MGEVELSELVAAVDGAAKLLVVTGAGISLASGIPTFRGSAPDAVWSSSVLEMGTNRFFERNPAESWRWYVDRFAIVEGKLPNPAHHALAELERYQLERGGDFLLVTQNVDGLHSAAGSEAVVEVHGSHARVRCTRYGCELGAPGGSLPRADVDLAPFRADPRDKTVPTCPACKAMLRQHVLWFDEMYTDHRDYEIDRVLRASRRADLTLFVGTSFSVGLTELVLETATGLRRAVFTLDPSGQQPRRSVKVLRARAEVCLPELVAQL